MNLRSKISIATFAAVSSVAALATAQQITECDVDVAIDPVNLGSEAEPVTCNVNGVDAVAFAIRNGAQITLVVDLIDNVGGNPSFADSFGFDAAGEQIDDCHPIDTDVDEGQRDEDAVGCDAAVQQDLAIEFNEG